MNKKVLIFVSCIFLCLTFGQILSSFGVFETKLEGAKDLKVAKWHIYVNDYDLNGTENKFYVDNVTYTNSKGETVQKFAPGVTGTFLLVIDPKDTEVSFKYDLSIDLSSSGYEQIKVDSIEGIDGTVLTNQNNVYSRTVPLSDIKALKTDKIKVTFSWTWDDQYNESDSTLGLIADKTFSIPISIKFDQQK